MVLRDCSSAGQTVLDKQDTVRHRHILIYWGELFTHEWWASDGSDPSTQVVCPRIPSPSTSLPLLTTDPLRQSITSRKWHFKRFIAFWPIPSASDRWLAERGVKVPHASRISRHGSWSQHTRWRRCSICFHHIILRSLWRTNGWMVTFFIFYLFFWAFFFFFWLFPLLKPAEDTVVLVEERQVWVMFTLMYTENVKKQTNKKTTRKVPQIYFV